VGIIKLSNIRVFAYHGCLTEEKKIGSNYRVDLEVSGSLLQSAQTDRLSDTVDYVALNQVVKEEMAKSSHLLETVAKRIITRVFDVSELVDSATVSVSKINPPIGGDVESVTIILAESRKNAH